MAYVPPALRRKQQQGTVSNRESVSDKSATAAAQRPAHNSNGNGSHRERLPRAEDVHDHYWPPDQESEEGRGLHFTVHSTLNSSRSEPDRLKYVMLFKDANPRWESDHLIYVKTNLHLLPGSEKFTDAPASSREKREQSEGKEPVDGKADDDNSSAQQPQPPPASGESASPAAEQPGSSTHTPDLSAYELQPVAVFEQTDNRSGGFRFAGYHRIARLQFLEPRSADLVRMLEQKFSSVDRFGRVVTQQRSPEAWNASLGHRWAVLQLLADEEAGKRLPAPEVKIGEPKQRVERKKKEGVPKKSVNELLREMRLGKEGETEEKAEDHRPAWT